MYYKLATSRSSVKESEARKEKGMSWIEGQSMNTIPQHGEDPEGRPLFEIPRPDYESREDRSRLPSQCLDVRVLASTGGHQGE
ncbi:hypothetical protein MLD38_009856 [Melastoma candidum]|uniref:Uncharacterized protein n=1 Tax=Melastoma candidum TaxID=119954 RepID=A0ACB9RYW4_9MYRT|nr:hypothetical protein MLD38_009856 [Melastoma candidum]